MDAATFEQAPLDKIFWLMDDKFRDAVVLSALKHRGSASTSVRDRLNGAISPLDMPGFRDASKAKPNQLQVPILDAIRQGNSRLASGVLAAWKESQEPLRCLVVEHLDGEKIPTDTNFAKNCFHASWSRDEWLSQRDLIIERHESLERDAVALMLCLASGRLPIPDKDEELPKLETPRFLRWAGELADLPPDAPEWDEAETFIDYLDDLIEMKGALLIRAVYDTLKEELEKVRTEYQDELRYLDVELDAWFGEAEARPASMPEALELIENLRKEMKLYSKVRPQAPSREEELRRASERAERETAIFDTVAEWRQLMARYDTPEPEPMAVGEPRTEYEVEEQAPHEEDADRVPKEAFDTLKSERDGLEQKIVALDAERDSLAQENQGLRLQKEQINEQIGELRSELTKSREMEERWRRCYVEEKKAPVREEEPITVANIKDAIALAQKKFPQELLIALNSKSQKNSPFQKPDEVFDALAWLATAYRNAPATIREACPGWFYKPRQTDTTMGMYTEWYQTKAEGRTFELPNHIGKGSSFDPKSTIRIGFAWDEEKKRVVVGFIGLHQKNRQS